MTDNEHTGKALRLSLVVILSVMAVWLGYAVLELASSSAGLGELVETNLATSGVGNPVTAVLLNFRGYDTLLEMAVLLVALLGVWSLGSVPNYRESSPGPVLDLLTRMLVPILVLMTGYLLWVGANAPGGAFQAGSLLAAAGVLLILSGWRPGNNFSGLLLRIVLVLGLTSFLVVGVGLLLIGGVFLAYPSAIAGELILLVEAIATLTIGLTLALLFLGSQPTENPDK
jgi:multisubunit Na+/H+ antiporter MnhB subunit